MGSCPTAIISYLPVFKHRIEPEELSIDIRANGIAANRGEQARNVPFFAKKLWDDDADNDGKPDFIAAPNLTTIASIAAAFLPPPVNLIASGAIQVGTSIASGVYYGKSAAEIVLDAGKSVALTAIGAATGGLGAGILGAASTSLVGSIAAAGISSIASSAANTLVGAVNMKNGYLNFDTSGEYWGKAVESGLQSLAISMVGAGVSYGVNTAVGGHQVAVTHENANGTTTTSTRWDFRAGGQNLGGALASRLGQVGSFVGSLASSLTGAAMGRDFNLNLGGAVDVNLTKVMNGDFSGVIQAGNTGLRLDSAIGAIQGIQAAGWLDKQSHAGVEGNANIRLVNELGTSTGIGANLRTFDQILGGSVNLAYDIHGDNRINLNDPLQRGIRYGDAAGAFGSGTIHLNDDFLNDRSDRMTAFGASVLAHEGFHLNDSFMDENREARAYRNQAFTYDIIKAQSGGSLSIGMMEGMSFAARFNDMAFNAYLEGMDFDTGMNNASRRASSGQYSPDGKEWKVQGEGSAWEVATRMLKNSGFEKPTDAQILGLANEINRRNGGQILPNQSLALPEDFQRNLPMTERLKSFAESIRRGITGYEKDGKTLTPERRNRIIADFANSSGINKDFLLGLMNVETERGAGFSDGRLVIRNEAHIFQWESGSEFNNLLAYTMDDPAKAQRYRTTPDGSWIDPHASQQTEYEYLNFNRGLDNPAAYNSISMGIGQLMGFNHQQAGYDSAEAMFKALSQNEGNQLKALFNFIKNDPILMSTSRNNEYTKFALRYNGSFDYAQKLQTAIQNLRTRK